MKSKMTPKEIGKLVRQYRKEQNFLQFQLAGVCGVGVRFIVDLEAGKPTIQLGKALRVLHMLGCKVNIEPPGKREPLIL